MNLADEISTAVNHPLLDPNKTIRLVTTAGRIIAWEREGADREMIVAIITGIMRQRSDPTPVRAWGYFDEPIRQAIADKKAMENFDATQRSGPAAARARRGRAAEQVLQEFSELEELQRTAAG